MQTKKHAILNVLKQRLLPVVAAGKVFLGQRVFTEDDGFPAITINGQESSVVVRGDSYEVEWPIVISAVMERTAVSPVEDLEALIGDIKKELFTRVIVLPKTAKLSWLGDSSAEPDETGEFINLSVNILIVYREDPSKPDE